MIVGSALGQTPFLMNFQNIVNDDDWWQDQAHARPWDESPTMHLEQVVDNLADATMERPTYAFRRTRPPVMMQGGAPMVAFRGGAPYRLRRFPPGLENIFGEALHSIPMFADPSDDVRSRSATQELMRDADVQWRPTKDGVALEVDIPRTSIERLRDHFRGHADLLQGDVDDTSYPPQAFPALRAHDPFAQMFGASRPATPYASLHVDRPEGTPPVVDMENILKDMISPEDGALGPWSRNRTTGAMFLRIPVDGVDPKKIKIKISGDRLVLTARSVKKDGEKDAVEEEDIHEEFSLPYKIGHAGVHASVKHGVLRVSLPPPAPSSPQRRGGAKNDSATAPSSKDTPKKGGAFRKYYESDSLPIRR
eukprot:g2381.t1